MASLVSSNANLSASISWRGIAYGLVNGTTPTFVAVADSGQISTGNPRRVATSTDNGNTWNIINNSVVNNENLEAITFGNGWFVAVSDGGTSGKRAFRSTNGSTWTANTDMATPTNIHGGGWYGIGYGLVNGTTPRFVAVGAGTTVVSGVVTNTIMTSDDNGNTWTLRSRTTSVNNHIFRDVTYGLSSDGNNYFIAVAYASSAIMRSIDGITWTFVNTTTPNIGLNRMFVGITYGLSSNGNNYFVAVEEGTPGTGFISQTGDPSKVSDWTPITFTTGNLPWFIDVEYGDGTFVILSNSRNNNNNNRFFAISKDAINWTFLEDPATSISPGSSNSMRIAYGNKWFVTTSSLGTTRCGRFTTQTPTITWSIPNKSVSDDAFTVTPSSNSAGAYTYSSSDPTTATINASTGQISILKAGTVTMSVTQAATTSFAPGTSTATFSISLANPTYSPAWSITSRTYGDSSFTINTPNSNSNGSFTYTSSDTSVASVSGTTVTINGVGTTTITANQAATSSYNSGSTTAVLTVNKGNPIYSTWSIPIKNPSDSNFFIIPPTSTSDGTFTYSSSNINVATINNTTGEITILGEGNTIITATQASSTNYNSGLITATFVVSPRVPDRIISFSSIISHIFI